MSVFVNSNYLLNDFIHYMDIYVIEGRVKYAFTSPLFIRPIFLNLTVFSATTTKNSPPQAKKLGSLFCALPQNFSNEFFIFVQGPPLPVYAKEMSHSRMGFALFLSYLLRSLYIEFYYLISLFKKILSFITS